MLKKFLIIIILLFSFSSWAQTCREMNQEIIETHHLINSILIPEISYTPDEYNCSLVLPTLEATYSLETHLTHLLGLYQDYYFECGREVEIVYRIEDTKINIILMQTLTGLAKNLHEQCSAIN